MKMTLVRNFIPKKPSPYENFRYEIHPKLKQTINLHSKAPTTGTQAASFHYLL